MPALLEVKDLSVEYGRLRALDGVNLAVPEGFVVALLGANGAGKSTLLKAVAGVVPVTSGEILLRGERIDQQPAHRRFGNGVCLIPEGRGIFPSLTVDENLRIALGGDGEAVKRVVESFPVLGQRMDQLAGTLSGGEQQMLALARAVGGHPGLLMADELSLGLAPMLVKTITDTLRRLHEESGQTILLVEQYATQALELAHLVYVLQRGHLVWAGEPKELLASEVLVESYLGT